MRLLELFSHDTKVQNFSELCKFFVHYFRENFTFFSPFRGRSITRLIRFCIRLIRARIRLVMGGYQPGNEGLLGWCAEVCEVVVAEVLAVGWQLVVLERGQDLLQLQEEALTGGVAVGEHVEPTPVPSRLGGEA